LLTADLTSVNRSSNIISHIDIFNQLLQQRNRSPSLHAAHERHLANFRNRSPQTSHDPAVSAPDSKKMKTSEPPPPAAADNSDDEKSDQDLVVDEVNDVSNSL